jgi:hypothetical protein
MKGMFSPNDSDSEDDEAEFPEIHDMEEIADTPIKECLELLSGSINGTAEKDILKTSFEMFVEFVFAISRRVEKFVEVELKSTPFFLWVWKSLVRAARELRIRGVKPDRSTLIILADISEDFEKVRKVFTMKAKPKTPVAKDTPGTSSEKKESEKGQEKISEKQSKDNNPENKEAARTSKKEIDKEMGSTSKKEAEKKEPERKSLNDSKQASEKEFEKALEKAFEQFLRAQNK